MVLQTLSRQQNLLRKERSQDSLCKSEQFERGAAVVLRRRPTFQQHSHKISDHFQQ